MSKNCFLAWLLFASTATVMAKPGDPAASPIHWQPLGVPGCGGAIVSMEISPHDPNRILVGGDMLGAALSTDGGKSWQSTFGFISYEMCDVTWHPTDPRTVWIGSATGPYVSHDGGVHFESKRQGMPALSSGRYTSIIQKVLFDPANVHHLLAFGGTSRHWNEADTFGWVWESHDDGEHWTHLTTITPNGSVNQAVKGVNIIAVSYVAGSHTDLVALASGEGVYLSHDGGKSWSKSNAGLPTLNVQRLALHPTKPNVMWLTVGRYKPDNEKLWHAGGVFKSTDGGKTWVNSSKGLSTYRSEDAMRTASYNALALSPSNPDVLYTNDSSWRTGVVYKSTDGGANWQPMATKQNVGADESDPERRELLGLNNTDFCLPAGFSLAGMTVDPTNPDIAFGFGTEYIAKTTDGGKTWTDASAYRPDPSQKDNWRGRGYEGWCATRVAFNPYNAHQTIVQGMDACKAWISDDDLKSWRYADTPPHPWLGGTDVSFTKDGTIYVATGQGNGYTGILRSTDHGKTWVVLAQDNGLPKIAWGGTAVADGIYANPNVSKLVWAILSGTLYHTADGGAHWHTVEAPSKFFRMAGDPTKAGRFYMTAPNGVYVTQDGKTFVNLGGPRPGGRGRINVDAKGRVIVCQWRDGRPGVWRYDPSSGKWTRLLDEWQSYECAADPTDPTRLALITNQDPFCDLAGGHGVWISADDGKTWTQENNGLAMRRGQAIAFNPHKPGQMIVGTFGRGFFLADWPQSYAPKGDRSYQSNDTDAQYALVPTATQNIVFNGSMTDGNTLPEYWDGKFGDVEVSRDTSVYHSQPASLKVVAKNGSGQAFYRIDGRAGHTLKVTGWAKCAGHAKVNFAVQSFDEKWSKNDFAQVGYLQNDTDWTKFTKEVTIPEWAARFHILLLVEGDGTGWLDDVNVVDEARDAQPPTTKP